MRSHILAQRFSVKHLPLWKYIKGNNQGPCTEWTLQQYSSASPKWSTNSHHRQVDMTVPLFHNKKDRWKGYLTYDIPPCAIKFSWTMHLESSIWHHERHCLWNDKRNSESFHWVTVIPRNQESSRYDTFIFYCLWGKSGCGLNATPHLSAICPSCWDQPNARIFDPELVSAPTFPDVSLDLSLFGREGYSQWFACSFLHPSMAF